MSAAVHDANEAEWAPRQAALLTAAVEVFYRFGYRKTSMEDVATAAGVSRQTLYLQFRNKERLFQAALEYLTDQMLLRIRNLSVSRNSGVQQTLMGVFEVLCGDSLTVSSQKNMAELMAAVHAQGKARVSRFDADLLSVIADILTRAGIAAHWDQHGIAALDLAQQLYDTSTGIRSATEDISEYRRRMALAIRIIVIVPRRNGSSS